MRVLSALVVLGAVVDTSAADSGAGGRDLWVEVQINSVPQPDFVLLHIDLRGHLFVRSEAIRAWHFRPRGSAEADDLVRIDDVPGLRARLDKQESVLQLEAEPGLFEAQIIAGSAGTAAPQRGMPAVFMGYNLFAEREGGVGTTYSGLLQAGSSLGRASLTSSWLGNHAVGAAADIESGWRRLDTDLLLDFPEYTARLTLGDCVTNPNTLGYSVRFVGVHWATDYATRPTVIPYALPAISGTATVPSTVEVFVNQALVQRTTVDAGPFEVNNVPVPLGQGTVDIRMRDILGQEQRLSMPYLALPQLLAAGLTASDFAAGAVRQGYGVESYSYRRGFLAGGVSRGLNENVTVNALAELVPGLDEVTARAGAAARVAPHVLVEWNPAVSYAARSGTGGAMDAGVDSLWSRAALGIHFRNASPGFVALGDVVPGERLHREWAAQGSAQLGAIGSLALVYAWRRTYDRQSPTTAALTASYNLSWRRVGSLGVFISNTRGFGTEEVMAGLTFTRYLGHGVTASLTSTSEEGASTVDVRLGQAAPADAGWGWNLAHARGVGVDSDGVRVDARSAYGSGSGEIDSVRSGTLGLLAWQGGLLWAAGRAWPAQSLTGPAAVVELPDLPDVEVLRDGQPAGHTDLGGRVLVSGLRPFEPNTITVAPEDLPLRALVDSDRLVVRPYSRGVVSAVLGVAATESRLFMLRLAGGLTAAVGQFVPAGASVSLNGRSFPVGTQGIAQLPVSHDAVDALVTWKSGHCRLHVPGLAGRLDLTQGADGPWPIECRKP